MDPHNHHSGHSGHHHNHTHNHGGHGHQHHPGCAHHHQNNIAPQQYFEKIQQFKVNGQYELYWMEIIKGTFFQKKMQEVGCNVLASSNSQVILSIVGMFHMMLNFEWLPNRLRPFVSGMFFPLIVLTILNFNVLSIEIALSLNSTVLLMPLFFFTLTALRGTGTIVNEQNQKKAIKAFELRPYLQNGPLKCKDCKIPKIFRSMHCPVCKVCNPKFTRHSLAFGTCIGAANQLLALFFFFSVFIFGAFSIYSFWQTNAYGLITKIMVYGLNIYTGWNGLHEFLTILILNLYYGITQFEAQSWIMLQYMMKIPQRKFYNNLNQGLVHNFKESCYALFGISGFESEQNKEDKDLDEHPLKQQINQEDQLGFPELVPNKKYVVNWAKAFFYLIPHIPNHPNRDNIINLMKIDEPKMIQNFRLMKKFKAEVMAQFPDLNQFQVQQRAMMKMHEHMTKNGPPAHMQMKMAPQQQKVIQLQMIGHLKQQFTEDKQMFNSFDDLESKLKNQEISPQQASMSLRELQQKILQRKMNQVLKQQQAMKKQQNIVEVDSKEKSNDIAQISTQHPKEQIRVNMPMANQPHPMQMNPQSHPMQMMMPPPEQQKAMMMMSFGNIKMQFSSHAQIIEQVQRLQAGLKNDSITIDEAKMSMMRLQPQLMEIKMKQMAKQNQGKQKSSHPMMPSSEQQKTMMLMSFGNIKAQFSGHKEIVDQVQRVQLGLKNNQISLDQAKISMSKIQPQLMQIKMKQMAKQNQGKEQPSHPMMPSPEQQKSMLLIGIENMRQKCSDDDQLISSLDKIKKGLAQDGMDMFEARIKINEIQSHIMKKVIEQTKSQNSGQKLEEDNSSNEQLEPQKRDK